MSLLKIAQELTRQGDQYIQKHGPDEFHLKATDLLASSSLSTNYHFEEVVKSSFTPFAVKQHFKVFEFSDLPLTIARGDHCFVDIYIWRRKPTAIHNHHFSGAFMCLEGENEDYEYTFTPEKLIGEYHETGLLKQIGKRILKSGDVAAIAPRDKFIHQNNHPNNLTVNLCFRTLESEHDLSTYLYSGLRRQKNPQLFERGMKLQKFLDIEEFKIDSVELTPDDRILFIFMNYTTQSERRSQLVDRFNREIEEAFSINVLKMINAHDRLFSRMVEG